jgi:hypothetical protein
MIDQINFWGGDDSLEAEIAPGHLSRRRARRASGKQDIALGLLALGRNVCFKKDSAPPPAPDPAIGQAAMKNAEMGQAWLDFSKEQFAKGELRQDEYDKLIKQVVDADLAQRGINNAYQDKMLGYQDEQMKMGREAQDRSNAYADKQLEMQDYLFNQGKEQDAYNKATFRPVEQKMVDEAMNYDSPERQEAMAAEARADVLDNAARQQASSERNMASMGINPASGRFAGVTRATDTATALASAGAQNKARNDVRQMGIMLRKDAANYSKGMASTAAQSYGIGMQAGQNGIAAAGNPASFASIALQAGQAGVGAGQAGIGAGQSAVANFGAGQNNFYANNGVVGQGFTGAMQGYANQGNILNNLYGNQLNAWGIQQQANAQSSAGWGSAIGSAVGAAAAMY